MVVGYVCLCVKKGILHFSYDLEEGLLGKYLVITPKKSKLKNHHRKFCLSKQEVFRELPVQKRGRGGGGGLITAIHWDCDGSLVFGRLGG